MSKQLPSYVGLVVLFVLSFLVLNWIYGYVIAFQSETNDCFFMLGRQFLLEFFDHPAGPLVYAGRFLGQFYHYQWLGALIVSASITCFGFLFHRVLVKLNGTVPVFQTLVPCLLLLALHTSTIYVIHDTLGLCASCASFLGYLSLREKLARRVYALVVTPIAYLLLGFYAWFFVAWIVAFEWLDGPLRSGLRFKVAYAVFSIAVPLVAWRWVFLIPLRSALMCPIIPAFRFRASSYTFTYIVVDCLLAGALTALLLLIPIWGRSLSGTRFAGFWRVRPGKRSRVALAVALAVLAILFHFIRYDAGLNTVVACRQAYNHEQWDAVLERAEKNPFGDIRLQFMTNFALCRKGKLLDEMFHYPQTWGTRGLVFNFSGRELSPAESDTCLGMFNYDLFYETGHINAAFTHVYNYMDAMGETYDVLEGMAQCSMVNGNYAMAAKYLNLLERTLFHRSFARRYKAIIADPDVAEREFGGLRRCLPIIDDIRSPHPVEPFATLLKTKSDNRMAFDYLTAWLLLDKRSTSIAAIGAHIENFKSAGYTSIPTHCQEALLLWERLEHTHVDLRGFSYDQATTARVEEFFQVMSLHRGRQDAPQQLYALYGDTYMFYFLFVVTAADVHRVTETRGDFGGTLREE